MKTTLMLFALSASALAQTPSSFPPLIPATASSRAIAEKECITELAAARHVSPFDGVILKPADHITTPETFKTPVEITIVAKTEKNNLRISYAADQVIFNWEQNRNQLRVDGGPANGKHSTVGGMIPANKFVTIKWVVTTGGQTIFVDGEQRFQHSGDYSRIDRAVGIDATDSRIIVKSVKVRRLDQPIASMSELR